MDELTQPADMVNHPPHYTSHPSGVEAIDIGRHLTAAWFNTFKYIFRADLRNGKQDVEKAIWYARDGVSHDTPVHSSTWRERHAGLTQEVIDAETDRNRVGFFYAIKIGHPTMALGWAEKILLAWPS